MFATTSTTPLRAGALALSVVAAALFGTGAAHAAPKVEFLAHQALYDLSLAKSRGNAAVSGASGRILYDFTGSACEGYASDFRQVSEIESGENKEIMSDLRSTSWEDADGKSFRFRIETRMNDGDPSLIDGTAERTGDKVTVKLKQPVVKTFTLDGATVFPTEQISRVITAAREGKSFLELSVYDGSDNGEKVYNTLTVIGQPLIGQPIANDSAKSMPDAATSSDALLKLKRWPVTVSYFDKAAKSDAGEQTPVYSMSFELYENGVSRSLALDYNDFVIAGKMDKFNVKDRAKPCK